jgi:hypothetical protein
MCIVLSMPALETLFLNPVLYWLEHSEAVYDINLGIEYT